MGGASRCCRIAGSSLSEGKAASYALRRFSSPLRFGTRKLYAMELEAAGGCLLSDSRIPAELAIYEERHLSAGS